jgi:glutaminyl-peptide cyclotransferase
MRFYRVRVVATLPHPGRGFTQGLLAENGTVWESVGEYGRSALRRYPAGSSVLASGVLASGVHTGGVQAGAGLASAGLVGAGLASAGLAGAEVKLADELFGEGICRAGDGIWQLTWKERIALHWNAATLELRDLIAYNREGWGIATVGDGPFAGDVMTSDGTSELVRRAADTLEPRQIVHVRCRGQRVRWLNDLAWSGGLLWANVAGTECLAGIDLATGEVTDVVDAHAAAERRWHDPQAIMNGIAALDQPGEFLLTGKRWRAIRQVRLVPDRDRGHLARLLADPWRRRA